MKKNLLALLSCASCTIGLAQQVSPQVVNSSGTTFSSASAVLSFNVGESAVTTIGGSGSGITQGFLQPVVGAVGLKETKQSISFIAFPNPVTDQLTIQTDYKKAVRAKVIDAMGRKVYDQEMVNNTISVKDLQDGIYQVLLFDSDQKMIGQKTITKTN
ncbi:MAG TPA: T9SS type A sorting domain-containing protein [Bacteroidia bacterium]